MKICLICSAQCDIDAPTCGACGEGSFTAEQASKMSAKAAPAAEPVSEMTDKDWAELEEATAPAAEAPAPSRKRR